MPSWMVGEGGLAELAQQHQAAGQAEVLVRPRPSSCSPAEGAEFFDHLGETVAGGEPVEIGIDPLFPQLLQFLQTLLADLVG